MQTGSRRLLKLLVIVTWNCTDAALPMATRQYYVKLCMPQYLKALLEITFMTFCSSNLRYLTVNPTVSYIHSILFFANDTSTVTMCIVI